MLGPVTITENGVDLGQVIGLHRTGVNDARIRQNSSLDWSRVGGVYMTRPVRVGGGGATKWTDPCVRIFLSAEEKKEMGQETYETYMGKGVGDRGDRYEQKRRS